MDIFNSTAGKVVVLRNRGGGSRAVLSVDGVQDVIIQRIGFSRQANVQFSPTLADAVYLYVFGDKVGQAEATGIAFMEFCSGGSGNGFNTINRWYDGKVVSSSRAQARFSVAGTVIRGYLLGLQTSAEQTGETGMVKFAMRMAVVE